MHIKSRHLLNGLRRQIGGSLIEVLVSIVIASIGLLALAGVNAAAARYAKQSQYRATATQLASDMADRMRANKIGATGNFGVITPPPYDYTATFSTQIAGTPSNAATSCTGATICTASQLAADDLAQWQQTVRAALPEGSVQIRLNTHASASDPWAADVHVVWRDPSVDSADENPALGAECPNSLGRAGDLSIRCLFFRVNL